MGAFQSKEARRCRSARRSGEVFQSRGRYGGDADCGDDGDGEPRCGCVSIPSRSPDSSLRRAGSSYRGSSSVDDNPGRTPILRKYRQASVDEPSSADALALNNLGRELLSEGDVQGAEPLFRQALALAEDTLGKSHPDTAICMSNLADVLVAKGDLRGGRAMHQTALELKLASPGPTSFSVAASYSGLAGVLRLQGDLEGSRQAYEKALGIKQTVLDPASKSTAATLNNLAAVMYATGDLDGAEKRLREALEIHSERDGADSINTATCAANLASLLKVKGDTDAAEPLLQSAYNIHKAVLGDTHPMTCSIQDSLQRLRTSIQVASTSASRVEHATKGVSLTWMAEFYVRCKSKLNADACSLREVVERVVMPETAADCCSYADLMGVPDSAPAFVVAASWELPFGELLQTLQQRFCSDTDATHIWMDIFAINHHDADSAPTAMAAAVAASQGTILVLDAAGASLREADCLLPMMLAVESSSPLELLPSMTRSPPIAMLVSTLKHISVDSVISRSATGVMTALLASNRLEDASPLISASIANGVPNMLRSMQRVMDGDEVSMAAEELATTMSSLGYHRPAAAALQIALDLRESHFGTAHNSTLATRQLLAANERVLTGDDTGVSFSNAAATSSFQPATTSSMTDEDAYSRAKPHSPSSNNPSALPHSHIKAH